MKKLLISLLFLSISAYGQTSVGTSRKSVVTDTNGVVINTPLLFTNQFTVSVAPSTANQVVRYSDLTNATAALSGSLTNIVNTGAGTGVVSSVSLGTGRIASLLPGTGITIANSGGTNITIATVAALTNVANAWTAQQTMSGGLVVSPTQNFQGGTNTTVILSASAVAVVGSPDQCVVRFGTTDQNTGEGSAWNYTTNAANGGKITILQDGIYSGTAILPSENSLYNGAIVYWTLNADANVVHLDPWTYLTSSQNLGFSFVPDPGTALQAPIATASFTSFLPSNSVLRVQGSPAVGNTGPNKMTLQQVMRK